MNNSEACLHILGTYSEESRYLHYNENKVFVEKHFSSNNADLHFTLDIKIAQNMYLKKSKQLATISLNQLGSLNQYLQTIDILFTFCIPFTKIYRFPLLCQWGI